MLLLLNLLWIGTYLSAPTWYYIFLAISFVAKILGLMVKAYDQGAGDK